MFHYMYIYTVYAIYMVICLLEGLGLTKVLCCKPTIFPIRTGQIQVDLKLAGGFSAFKVSLLALFIRPQ